MFNTDSERRFQNLISQKEGLIISEATLLVSDLLDAAYSVMFQNGLNTDLCHEIESLFSEFNTEGIDYGGGREKAEYLWNEDAFNYFNNICPDDYYFGSNEGDGACIGFFQINE